MTKFALLLKIPANLPVLRCVEFISWLTKSLDIDMVTNLEEERLQRRATRHGEVFHFTFYGPGSNRYL